MKILYITWQDPKSRRWLPVGRLSSHKSIYYFHYTKGAEVSELFKPFGRMKWLDKLYESSELFPIFSNRLMTKSRPEYKNFLNWMDLKDDEAVPINILSITGGVRNTDSLELFPCPEPNEEGLYEVKFFTRGISHLPSANQERVNSLKRGERLFILKDIQNPFDKKALVLRSDDPISFCGYCPRFFNDDFNFLLEKCLEPDVRVTVEKVNTDAPMQMRVLCKLSACWPDDFKPCETELYKPIPTLSTDYSCTIN